MSRVSIRYAKAIFSLAIEEDKLSEVATDLSTIKSLIQDNEDFASFVVNPLISSNQQASIVDKLLSGKVETFSHNFLQLICKKKRLNLLSEIIHRFDELLMAHKNQVFAQIISANGIESAQLEQIKSNLESMTGKTVLLNSQKDSGLVGGFTVQIEGVIIDNSVQNQLSKLKEKLIS